LLWATLHPAGRAARCPCFHGFLAAAFPLRGEIVLHGFHHAIVVRNGMFYILGGVFLVVVVDRVGTVFVVVDG
jgi:hypothetical protein